MNLRASSYHAASAEIKFRTIKGLAESLTVMESRPITSAMQRQVHRNLLCNLRRAIERPGGLEPGLRLASSFRVVADMFEDIALDARLQHRSLYFPELDRLVQRLTR
jgi:hypothetical protein